MDPFVYQYTLGGIVFAVGMLYAARQGYLGFSGQGLRNTVVMFAGLAAMAAIQGYLQQPEKHQTMVDLSKRSILLVPEGSQTWRVANFFLGAASWLILLELELLLKQIVNLS